MEIIGYSAAILIGVSLGLLGGGGSILTLPVLVYFFGIAPVAATTYSLFIVGVSSLTGSARFLAKKMVDPQIVVLFGLPSVAAVILARRLVLPAIPPMIQISENISVSKGHLLMIAFALIMIFSAVSMLRRKSAGDQSAPDSILNRRLALLLPAGILVGSITGILGAGGGFVIIPVLVLWMRMPMKKAVGTSLTIIAINSMIGFLLSIGQSGIDWQLFSAITVIAVAGIIIGTRIAIGSSDQLLRKAFGSFILVLAAWIFIKELFIS